MMSGFDMSVREFIYVLPVRMVFLLNVCADVHYNNGHVRLRCKYIHFLSD